MNNWNNFWSYMQSYANYESWSKYMQNFMKTDVSSEAQKLGERIMNIQHDFMQDVGSKVQDNLQILQKTATENYESWKSSIENQDYKEFFQSQQENAQKSFSQASHFAQNMLDASTKYAKNIMDTVVHNKNSDHNKE